MREIRRARIILFGNVKDGTFLKDQSAHERKISYENDVQEIWYVSVN
jgi:hypothetical protein